MRSGQSVLHAHPSCWHRTEYQTENPRLGKLQDWQGSPTTPSPNRMPERASGIVKKLGHSAGPASVQSCLPFLLGMV